MGSGSSKSDEDSYHATSVSHNELPVLETLKQLQRVPHMRTGSLALVRADQRKQGISSWFCTCTIDAPVACRVGLYLLAREEGTGRVHSSFSEAPLLKLNYEPGMDQSFPGKFASAIHLGSPQNHIKATGDRYPIMLRIESLAPAYASRYTLDSLPAIGSDVNKYMCVHTVFAHVQLKSGGWDVAVQKEHLWLAGNPFCVPTDKINTATQVVLLQRPRMAATPAQLWKRRLQQLPQPNQHGLRDPPLPAARSPQYPPAAAVPQYPPGPAVSQPPAGKTALPPAATLYGQSLAGLSPAAPLQTPFATSQGMAALPPAAPLQSPFAAGFPQQQAAGNLPLVAHLA